MNRSRLVPAASLALVAIVVCALMWAGYSQHWSWLHSADWSLLNAAHDIGVKSPAWVSFWEAVSFILGPRPLFLLAIVAAVVALLQRNVRTALLLLCCGPLSGLVTWAVKSLVGRPRPVTALVVVSSTSFPSGHSLEVMAGVLALLAFLLPLFSRQWLRVIALVVGALDVLAVGISRVALNVHHPSDVIAGWALGYAYFLVLLWVSQLRLNRNGQENSCCAGVFIKSQPGDSSESKHLLDSEVEPG